jgi:hypothetical protein
MLRFMLIHLSNEFFLSNGFIIILKLYIKDINQTEKCYDLC